MSVFEEEDGPEVFTFVSARDNYYVLHPGDSPKEHSKFANIALKPDWPKDLWTSGEIIYSLKQKEKCLPPPSSPDDHVLRFDSHFESGNLNKVFRIDDQTYHLILEYDADGSCQWFYFRINNMRAGADYKFYISGFHKEKSLFSSGHKCFMYSQTKSKKEGISWFRCGDDYSFSVTSRSKSKQKRATVQFVTQFPYDCDTCYLCYAIPYTYSDMLRSIHMWSKTAPPGVFHSEILCHSLCGRDVPVITITSSTSQFPLAGRSCIFLTGRIHPGESTGSHVLHGLIDFLLSDDPMAHYIIEHCIVRIVPMIAVDGVIEGSCRVSMMGDDLSRKWINPNPALHPVISATKDLIIKTATERPISVYIDFHGHAALHGSFAYGCPNNEDEGLKNAEKLFPRLFALVCNEFSWENCTFSFPKDRKGAGRIVVRKELGVVHSFTLETSFGGIKSGPDAGFLFDVPLWEKVGVKCVEAIYHLLTPNTSPLVAYVNKELQYFVSTTNRRAEKRTQQTNSSRTAVESSIVVEDGDLKEEENSSLLKAKNGGALLKRKEETRFFNIKAEMLQEGPPSRIKPSWHQLQYKR